MTILVPESEGRVALVNRQGRVITSVSVRYLIEANLPNSVTFRITEPDKLEFPSKSIFSAPLDQQAKRALLMDDEDHPLAQIWIGDVDFAVGESLIFNMGVGAG